MKIPDNVHRFIEPSSWWFCKEVYPTVHVHGEYELIFCLSGEAYAYIDEKEYHLTDGKGVFVFPYQVHSYETVVKGEFCVVIFKPEMIPTFKEKLSRRIPEKHSFEFNGNDDISKVLYASKSQYDVEKDKYRLLLAGYINFMVDCVYKKMEFAHIDYKDAQLYEQILEYCNERYTETVFVSEIAKVLLTNPNRISRVFNNNMKMGIPRYIEALRFSKACQLIETSDYSIAKISEEAGFGSIRSLNRAFENFLKITPKQYKKRIENNQKYDS
ncbi:MAG: helix-turn-helix transcriptional regulator [Acutalibacteraceae bacterium]|nr:helix-turn-helix transcriptional regulator [Acutalibacteraceae bacterium]